MGTFERFLSIWVGLCIIIGICIGQFFGDQVKVLSDMTYHNVNMPVAILVWFMIFPMMVQIDFSSIKRVGKNVKGLFLTLSMNWLVKPFTMAFFAWLFFEVFYSEFLSENLAKEYIAGAILLGAAPCTAMVFVWSYLTKGDAAYTLVQVAVNDLVLLFAFIPIVGVLLGVTNIEIPMNTLLLSVFVFIVIPLVFAIIVNKFLRNIMGDSRFENSFLKSLKPLSIVALMSTLIILFAFQGDKIINNPLHILLISVPLLIQTYFIFFVSWKIGRKLKLKHSIVCPASMIGASNFFELAVAVAIALFGLNSGAALVTVVGVLIEVPVMLHLVKLANKWRY